MFASVLASAGGAVTSGFSTAWTRTTSNGQSVIRYECLREYLEVLFDLNMEAAYHRAIPLLSNPVPLCLPYMTEQIAMSGCPWRLLPLPRIDYEYHRDGNGFVFYSIVDGGEPQEMFVVPLVGIQMDTQTFRDSILNLSIRYMEMVLCTQMTTPNSFFRRGNEMLIALDRDRSLVVQVSVKWHETHWASLRKAGLRRLEWKRDRTGKEMVVCCFDSDLLVPLSALVMHLTQSCDVLFNCPVVHVNGNAFDCATENLIFDEQLLKTHWIMTAKDNRCILHYKTQHIHRRLEIEDRTFGILRAWIRLSKTLPDTCKLYNVFRT